MITRTLWAAERKCYPAFRYLCSFLPKALPTRTVGWSISVLSTPQKWREALFTAWSVARFADAEVLFFVDGQPSPRLVSSASRVFRNFGVFNLRNWLADKPLGPRLRFFTETHPLGPKLALNFFLSAERSVLLLDDDVLFFNDPGDFFGSTAAFLQEGGGACYATEIVTLATNLNIQLAEGVNSGLLFLPKHSVTDQIIEQLLGNFSTSSTSWFVEQTLNAALLAAMNALPLPKTKFLVSNQRQFCNEPAIEHSTLVARHFTNPTRHLMYRFGYTHLLSHLS